MLAHVALPVRLAASEHCVRAQGERAKRIQQTAPLSTNTHKHTHSRTTTGLNHTTLPHTFSCKFGSVSARSILPFTGLTVKQNLQQLKLFSSTRSLIKAFPRSAHNTNNHRNTQKNRENLVFYCSQGYTEPEEY